MRQVFKNASLLVKHNNSVYTGTPVSSYNMKASKNKHKVGLPEPDHCRIHAGCGWSRWASDAVSGCKRENMLKVLMTIVIFQQID